MCQFLIPIDSVDLDDPSAYEVRSLLGDYYIADIISAFLATGIRRLLKAR